MKKRLTAVFLALCLVLSVVTLPVSASDLGKDVLGAYAEHYGQIGAYWVYLSNYLGGKISYDAFKLKTEAIIYDIDEGNGPISGIFSGLCESLEGFNYGVTTVTADTVKLILQALSDLDDVFGNGGYFDNLFKSLWDKFCNKNGYTTSDFDMKGYGAVCITTDIIDNTISEYYGDYGIIYDNDRGATIYGDSIYYYSVPRGNYDNVTEKYIDGSAYCYNGAERYSVKYYGNWSYEDETPADDLITDTGESSLSPDELPEDTDLTDFLNDLLEKLMNAFPDTSTIEGLLRAILAKLDTLDSDNDNEILMQILVAIQALEDNGQNADNSELVKTLNDLKKALIIGDGAETVTLGVLLKKLVDNQIKLSDITIDESLYNQRFKLVQARLLTKFGFFMEINDFVNYAVDCYKNTSENPTIMLEYDKHKYELDFSYFNEYIDAIRFIVAAFVYLTFAFKTFRKIPGYINGGDNT